MASEDFIELGSGTGSEAIRLGNETLAPIKVHPEEGNPVSDNLDKVEPCDRENDDQLLQRVDLDDDLIHQSVVLQESVELTESVTVAESVNMAEPGYMENGPTGACIVDNHLTEQSSMTGVKRVRVTSDEQPSVHVVFKSLTRASRKKLEELLKQWSEWHAQNEAKPDASSKEALEYGEQTYFPALYVGLEKSAMVSFRVDKRARNGEFDYVESDLVPLYDRGYVLGSTSANGSADSERIEPLEASRCFNCSSYSHSLKDCPKPRDNVAINLARKQHSSSKRNSTSGSRNQTRYYQSSSGKYDDLRAGVLGPELRKCLGIGEFDPPPWLHRMRELGYPPGYLDVVEDEDQPSGITIYADEETNAEYEEGELSDKGEPEPPEKKMTVDFPGINAPIPENGDSRRWAASPAFPSSSDSLKSRTQHRPNRFEINKGSLPDQKRSWDHRDNGPSSLDYAAPCQSPGYSPFDRQSVPRSPSLRRSLSDRARAPLPHEGSPGHILQSSSLHPSGHTQSTAERYGWTATVDHRGHENQHSASAGDSSLRRDRSNARHHQRR
uniref:Zinc finger CCHC domain-containing protein 8 n=1 Tax=Anthurium amnicola TaxID=1678845 RepID=A0A1D1Z7Q8_9ARAE